MTFLIGTMLVAFIGPIVSLIWQSPAVQNLTLRADTDRSAQKGPQRDPLHWAQWFHKGAYGLMLLTLGFNVMPFNYQALGVWSLAVTGIAALVTWAVPKLIGTKHQHQAAHRSGLPTDEVPTGWLAVDPRLPLTMMALAGFLIHAMADGASLYSFGDGLQPTWGPALLLDRIAVGFFVWVLVLGLELPEELKPFQRLFGWTALLFLCLATTLGYFMMQYVVQIVTDPLILGTIQSVLAGVVLQLILGHRHAHGQPPLPQTRTTSHQNFGPTPTA